MGLAAVALLGALLGGGLAARAQSTDPPPPRRAPAAAVPVRPALPCPTSAPTRRARPAAGGPSRELLGAFGVLRRERRPEDALPAEALRALRAAGLEPEAGDAARLLRTTPTDGRAWVVPVADARAALAFDGPCAPVLVTGPVPRGLPPGRRPRRVPRLPARPPGATVVPARPVPGARPAAPAPPSGAGVVPDRPAPGARPAAPAPPSGAAVVPARPTPAVPPTAPAPPSGGGILEPLPQPAPRRGGRPVEGLAVVALGDAAAGGGGSRADLVRGRAPVDVDACAGPRRDMLGVSGIVPDGVGAVYLTSPDGTAVRADVRDNGFAFVVPRPATAQPRYVVWTGADGTPHVQPVAPVALGGNACAGGSRAARPRVTPRAACLALPAPLPAGARRRVPPPCVLPAAPSPRIP